MEIVFYGNISHKFVWLSICATAVHTCTFPPNLWGNWTSTNLGTVKISGANPGFSMTKTFDGQTVNENLFQCLFNVGSQYALKSNTTVPTFAGNPAAIMYMCLDFKQISSNSYYYYMNSGPPNNVINGFRIFGITASSTSPISQLSDICTTTLDQAEFNTMIRIGYETEAIDAVQCPTPLLALSQFTYNTTNAYCDNVNNTINACGNLNRTHVEIQNKECSNLNILFSAQGLLGCIANVYNSTSSTYYTSLYNLDTTVDNLATYKFICLAITTDQSSSAVYVSIKSPDCISGQSSTAMPSGGAIMVLMSNYTCLPPWETKSKNWVLLYLIIALLVCFVFISIFIICLYLHLKKIETRKASQKKAMDVANHPMGEPSISLDAPGSMEKVAEIGYAGSYRPRSSIIDGDTDDLLSEKSLKLSTLSNIKTRAKIISSQVKLSTLIEREHGDFTDFKNSVIPPVRSLKTILKNGTMNGAKSKTNLNLKHFKNNFVTAHSNVPKSSRTVISNASNENRNTLGGKSKTGLSLKTSNSILGAARPFGPLPNQKEHPKVHIPSFRIKNKTQPHPKAKGSFINTEISAIDKLLSSRNLKRKIDRSKSMVLSSSISESADNKDCAVETQAERPQAFITENDLFYEVGLNIAAEKEMQDFKNNVPAQSEVLRDVPSSDDAKKTIITSSIKKPVASKHPWR